MSPNELIRAGTHAGQDPGTKPIVNSQGNCCTVCIVGGGGGGEVDFVNRLHKVIWPPWRLSAGQTLRYGLYGRREK